MPELGRAVIVGAGGQDGRLLQSSLGLRGISTVSIYRQRLQDPSGSEREFKVFDAADVKNLLAEYQPHQIYYLAAHHTSSQLDGEAAVLNAYDVFHNTHVVGLHNFLEAIRHVSPDSRLFYASSSLVFDGSIGPKQSENTPFSPVGFYGLTKLQGMMLCRHYRKEHNIFASSGILYSHESLYRQSTYLSKKIISTIHAISRGIGTRVSVGDLDGINDWGYAADFVQAFQDILEATNPTDYIVATGEGHSVREFAQIVCDFFGLNLADCILEDKKLLLRRTGPRIGDFSKLHDETGWKPSLSFQKMVRTLVQDYVSAVADT
jgi:GDPmannose 4,6-dehydratase